MFTLLGTEDCHLCDLAKGIIIHVAQTHPVEVYVEDISESEDLVARYGTRIPVIRHDVTGTELEWPFDKADLLEWLTVFTDKTSIKEL